MRGIVGLMVAGLVAGGAHAGAAPRSGVDGKAALESNKFFLDRVKAAARLP